MKKLIPLLGVVFLCIGCTKKEISGEAFIVTKSRNNIKLGLLEIKFIPKEIYHKVINQSQVDSLKREKKIRDSTNAEFNKVASKGYSLISLLAQIKLRDDLKTSEAKNLSDKFLEEYLMLTNKTDTTRALEIIFSKLDSIKDERIPTTKTNSDGMFYIKLNKEKYFLIAYTNRLVFYSEEQYKWAFWYEPDDSRPLFLSNDNMIR